MSNEIKISVIVPVYNSEKYLKQCIDSIVNQTLEDIEIIAINDCSTDNSLKILEQYKDNKKFKLISLEKNSGPGGARNAGLKAASGEYIGFVDSDDYIKNEMYEKLYKIAKRANYDVVDSALYWEKGKKEVQTTPQEAFGEITTEKRDILVTESGYLYTKIIKRSIIIENNVYFRENICYEDTDFLPVMFLYAKKVGATNNCFYTYRNNDSSLTNKFNKKRFIDERKQSMYAIIDRFKKANAYEEHKEALTYRLFRVYSNILYHIMFKDYELTEKFFKDMRDFFFELQYDYKNNKYIKTLDKRYLKIAEINNNNYKDTIKFKEQILKNKF